MTNEINTNDLNEKKNEIIELNEDNFDSTVGNPKPTLVDFWATWCGPCQYMSPIFDKLSKLHGEKITFGRLNVDQNQAIAAKYEVYAIPTFIMFLNGNVDERAVGAVGEKGLDSLIAKYK